MVILLNRRRKHRAGGGGSAFDVSSASYASKSVSVTAQCPSPAAMCFGDNGTKLYVAGSANDTIYQYDLTVAWDVSTASYASKSMSVTTEETQPSGITFNGDGTRMFVTGSGGTDRVYRYTLTTAWDISTGAYASLNLSVTAQVAQPYALAFNDDGTILYVLDNTPDEVEQYTLSTPYLLSSASYASKTLVVTEAASPGGLAISSDGTKVFVCDLTSDTVYQYTLSTAWDLSTGSYDSVSFSVTSQDTTPRNIQFSADGTKLYVMGGGTDTVYQYAL